MNFLEYMSVIQCIPVQWKTLLNSNVNKGQSYTGSLEFMGRFHKVTAPVYKMLIEKETGNYDHGLVAWQKELHVSLSREEWQEIWRHGFEISMATKLQSFQYRLLSKKLVTNVQRHRWDKNISELCSFCTTKKETILHIMGECDSCKMDQLYL